MVASRASYGRADKRAAIVAAGRRIFGRDGYARASMDVIAAEAGVSKRTIYNHFADKQKLFEAVAAAGSDEVTAEMARVIDRHLHKIVDLERDLIDFSLERLEVMDRFAEYFALARTIEAEADRLPAEILDTWLAAAPQTGHLRLASYLEQLPVMGVLHIDNPDRAARHLTALTVADVTRQTLHGARPLPPQEVKTIITEGVQAFLKIYPPS
jgi:AcrR family transcriptional regulator